MLRRSRRRGRIFCWKPAEVWCRTTLVFARHLVESALLDDDALRLAVRLNWYRSLPLACVEQLAVSLDGRPLDAGRATLELGGIESTVADLADADDRWWHVLDTAHVRVPLDAAPPPGVHAVELVLGTRIPYLVTPGGDAAVIVDRGRAAVSR
jgi:hypothetical protein